MDGITMISIARVLLVLGVVLVVASGLFFLAARLNLPLGRLPGDIRLQSGNVTCVFPIVTSIIASIVLTILLNVIVRFLNR